MDAKDFILFENKFKYEFLKFVKKKIETKKSLM
jgi:hypothetical protein